MSMNKPRVFGRNATVTKLLNVPGIDTLPEGLFCSEEDFAAYEEMCERAGQ